MSNPGRLTDGTTMNTKALLVSGVLLSLAGCVVHEHRDRVVMVRQPAPAVVEEGAVYQGVVVAEPGPVADYVFINGGFYYWHPGLRCWVHAHRPEGWHPEPDAHVYYNWTDHPIYHTAPPAEPPPGVVEEGAAVDGVVVAAPETVSEYVFIGSGWYYWHPGFHCWVHAHRGYDWRPTGGVHIYHSWGEHPMYRHR
jgi:hypothetical protein